MMRAQLNDNATGTTSQLPATLEVDMTSWARSPALRDAEKAQATLRAIAALLPQGDHVMAWLPVIAKHAIGSYEPDRALNNWKRLLRAIADVDDLLSLLHTSPQMASVLSTLFGGSQYLTDMVLHDTGIFAWCSDSQRLFRPRSRE